MIDKFLEDRNLNAQQKLSSKFNWKLKDLLVDFIDQQNKIKEQESTLFYCHEGDDLNKGRCKKQCPFCEKI